MNITKYIHPSHSGDITQGLPVDRLGCAIWELIVAFSDGTLGTVDADEMREELEDVLQLYYELNGDGTGQEVPQTIYRIPGDGEGPAGSA